MISSILAATEFGELLQNDHNNFFKIFPKYSSRSYALEYRLESFSETWTSVLVKEASDASVFLGVSTYPLVMDIFLKAEHQSHVDTRLACTAIKFAPKPLTTGWYKAISLYLLTTKDKTAPIWMLLRKIGC